MIVMNKNLDRLLYGLKYQVLCGDISNIKINKICYNTSAVEKDDLFICIEGSNFDSHTKISEVSDKGAKVIVVSINNKFVEGAEINDNVVVIAVANTRIALAIISSNYFDNPEEKLKIIGITGTKGKTTSAFMLKKVLECDGAKVGMIGTVGIFYGDKHIETENTTPESYTLFEYFAKMFDEGCKYVVMEVSSQSLKYNRVFGIRFNYVIWTNISPEHIGKNEHDDFNDYLNSKLKIFTQSQNAIINANTSNFDDIIDICKKNQVGVFIIRDNINIELNIPGKYNLENANVVYKLCEVMGISDRIIRRGIKETVVPGRCEVIYKNEEYEVIVDFAHEQNGAKVFLETMREYIDSKACESKGRLVVVFGCGGNRAKERRYGMGEIVGELADFIVLTADNSRYEKTIDIIADIETTLCNHKKLNDLENGYIIKESRRDAILYAINNHKKGDVICVIGKGHESTSEENGIKTHFSDKETILNIIKNK